MDYEGLLHGIAWTKSKWGPSKLYRRRKCKKYIDFSYSGLRQRGDDYWLHLQRMGEKELGEEVINCFLNIKEFNCHIDNPGTDKGDKLVQNLKNAVDALPDAYAALAVKNRFRVGWIRYTFACAQLTQTFRRLLERCLLLS